MSEQLPAPATIADAISPEAIARLLEKDPIDLSTTDLDNMILHFRAERARWGEAEAKGKKSLPGPNPGAAKVSLEDLTL